MPERSNEPQPALSEGSSNEPAAGKGRPTPKRKDAEAANKRPLVNTDRKSAARTDRAKDRERTRAEYLAARTGDEKNMALKDRGPQRRFMRDAVDARWNLGEFFIPVVVVMLVLQVAFRESLFGQLAVLVTYTYIIVLSIDCLLLWLSVKKRLRAKFGPDVPLKGAMFYTVIRAMQIRRSRLPKPQVKHGQRPS